MSPPAGTDGPASSPTHLPIGRTLYTAYLDQYSRRLRKAVPAPTDDAAGLICGRRYQGRRTPLKGKGTPPPDHKEEQFVAAKHMVPGKSFTPSFNVLTHSEVVAESEGRNCIRMAPNAAYTSQLSGGSAKVTSEAAAYRPLKRPTTATVKTGRVLCQGDEGEVGVSPMYAYYSSARQEAFACRPTTAPPCVLRGQTIARKQYEQCQAGHADVIQYRYSGGICPSEYKIIDSRPATPQLVVPSPQSAREAFFDTRRSYDLNKVRSFMSQSIVID